LRSRHQYFCMVKSAWLLSCLGLLLQSCSQGVEIDEGTSDISFTGAETVTKTDIGTFLMSWTKAEGGGDQGVFAYNIYYRDYGVNGADLASALDIKTDSSIESYWVKEVDPQLTPAFSGKILSRLDAQTSSYPIDLALKASHVYGFQVRAQNPDGIVDNNNSVVFIQIAEEVIYKGCLQASLNEFNQVVLSFDYPTYASRIIVYRNSIESHSTSTAGENSWVDTSVVPGNSYEYTCSAQDAQGTLVAGQTKSLIQVPRKYSATEVQVCTSEGQVGCVTTAEFPSVNTNTVAARVVAGEIVAGVSGTAALTPISVCTTDGQKSCIANDSYPAAERNGIENKIVAGYTAAGILGAAQGKLPDCAQDGEIGCSTTSTYRAADMNSVVAPNIKTGTTIAGINGSYTGSAPATCSSDGEVDCVANTNYRAASISALPPKVIIGEAVAGVAGTAVPRLSDCSVDGQVNCTANSSYKAADMSLAVGTNIRQGIVVAGTTGTLTTSAPSACVADGELNCVSTPTYRAALTTGLAGKIITTNTVAGIPGTGLPRLADCNVDGQTSCTATSNFIAADKSLALAPNIKDGVTLAGTLGTMTSTAPANCSGDGQTSCVAVPNYPAAAATGLASKVVTNFTVAGIAGTAASRLTDCSTDGQYDCTATSNYRSVNMSNALAANIKDGVTLAGVSGSLTSSAPATCSSDGQSDCVANTNYRAAATSGLAAKVGLGQTVAGVAGTLLPKAADCSLNGQIGCTSNANYPAADLSIAVPTNIRDGINIAGITGSLTTTAPAACSADGETSCVATSTYAAALTTGLAAKIITSNTVAGIAGTGLPRLADCNTDGQVGCTTTSGYKSADGSIALAPNIKSGVTIAGIAGSMTTSAPANCSSDGQTSCVAVPNFAAAATTGLAAKVLTPQTVAGVSGTAIEKYPDCLADGQVLCSTTVNFKAADMSRVIAGNIKSGVTIGNVAGDYPSATYPLAANTGATDLPSSWPPTAGAYEWFDSAGNVATGTVAAAGTKTPTTNDTTYTASSGTMFRDFVVQGDADLVVGKLKFGENLFGLTGTYSGGTACSSDGQADGCTTNGSYKAASMATATAANIKTGITIAGVTGSFIGVNASPTISITEPYGDDDSLMPGNQFNIQFNATDTDSSASISLYYSDANTGCNSSLTGWTLITSTLTEGTHSSYNWSVPATEDTYYICAKITDGVNAAVYSVSAGGLAVGGQSAHTCSDNDDGFASSDGGCKFDQRIWSNRAATDMNWYSAVWDSDLSGNAAADVYDPPGSFDDYSNGSPASYTDASTTNYCHDLVEGGYRDWRLPTKAELEDIAGAGAATHFNFVTNTEFWSGQHYALSGSAARNKYTVNLSSAAASYDDVTLDNSKAVACVRNASLYFTNSSGDRANAGGKYRIYFTSSEDTNATISLYYSTSRANCSGDPATNGWTLITNSLTDDNSTASHEWSIGGGVSANDYYFCAKLATGTASYAVSRYPLTVVAAPSVGCASDAAGFTSQDGGCKYGTLVWSQKSPMLMSWNDAIWDSELSGNAQEDVNDDAGVYNDYYLNGIPASNGDSSLTNYCHDLVEGGFSDWRMPAKTELEAVQAAGAATYFNFGVNENFWSNLLQSLSGANTANKYYVNLSSGTSSTATSSNKYRVICVRVP
jgi:hypothetical protein